MAVDAARFAVFLAMACLASAYVNIPDDLKRGKMRQYAACRSLFAQNAESYAVVAEDEGQFKKVCNCSFYENPPQSGLRINCHYAREVVIPITIDMYRLLGDVTYFIVKYRIRDSGDNWKVERVEASGSPRAQFNLDLGYDGSENIYEIEIYAVLSDNTQKLIMSDQLSSNTGRSILSHVGPSRPIIEEREYGQATQSFQMSFARITDTTMELTFRTQSPNSFKVEYINNGRRLVVDLDSLGQATLTGLQPDTEYIFIISYYQDSKWVEMRRKPVRTMASASYRPSYTPTYNYGTQDITLECPVVVDENLQTISWYKVPTDGSRQLLATYDAQSGETSYPSNRDPKLEIIDGTVLKIRAATQEYAGHYKCRYSIIGAGYTWQSPVEPELVTLYITWQTLPGIVGYYIQYRPYGTTQQWQTVTLRNTDRPSTIIRDLQPVTEYIFNVYDYSGGVRGDLLDTLTRTTTLTSSEGPGEDPCALVQCGHGVCNPAPRPHCECDDGYAGTYCDTVAVNYCDSNPCLNGGICNPRSDRYVCQCLSGYSGINCERERTPCNPNPCRNNGVCVTVDNSYICRCRRGYGGNQCQLLDRSNPCDDRPCVHGSCSVLGRNYHCECDRGYIGRNCDQVDTAPSILLRCPIQEDVYGSPELIQWVRISTGGRRQPIYRYDVVNQRRAEGTTAQYRGRIYSPSIGELIIRDSRPSDAGTYQCIVSYENIRISPSEMRIVRVPIDDTRVTVTWRPSRLYIDHYNAKYRDVESEDDWTELEIPASSRRYTFSNLQPGGIYEIAIVPYTQPNEVNEPMNINVIPSDTPTTTVATTTTTTGSSSRGDSFEKYIEEITVSVSGPRSPVEIGNTAYLVCYYPTYGSYKPTITWKKISGDRALFLYNQKMPPSSSRNRITMVDERRLRISNFQQTDAGTYECNVEYETDSSFKVGRGRDDVEAAEMAEIPAPTNLIIDVTGPDTTVLTWQRPRNAAITGYIIRYYPTTARFGEYQREETTEPRIILESLTEGNEYNVEIRATDGRKYSEPLQGHFEQAVEKIPSPTAFQAQMLSATTAKITWQAPVTDGITGYKVQYWDVSRPAAGNLVERTTRPGVTEMVLSNLFDGTVYQVWIQTKKGDNLSPQLSSQFTKTTPVIPNAPAIVRFKNVQNDQVTAYWSAPVGWNPRDKYRVLVKSLDQDYPFQKQYPDSAPAMITVTSLHPGVLYRFTVNTVRDGVLSNPVYGSVKTDDVITLTVPFPEELTLECESRISSRAYQVRWYKIDDSGNDNLIFTSYYTSTRNASIPNRNNEQFAGRLTAPSLKTLNIANVRYPEDFGKYKCIVSATTGRTGYHILELVARYPTVIAPPEDLEFQAIDDSSAKISWQHPYEDDISSYVIKYRPKSDRSAPEKIMETTNTEAVLSGLTSGPEYTIDVKAKINDRESEESLTGAVSLDESVKEMEPTPSSGQDRNPGITFPSPVSNLRVEPLSSDSLLAMWEPTPDVHFDFYRVVLTNVRSRQDERFNVTSPTITVTQLQPYQTFDVAVSTVRNGAFSFPVAATVTLRDVEGEVPPGELEPDEEVTEYQPVELAPAPTNLRFSNVMRNRFTASWDSSDANVIDFVVKSRPTGTSRWTTVRTGGYPSITLRGLRSGTEYEVEIYALLVTGERSSPLSGRQTTQQESRRVILRQPVVRVIDKTNDSFSLRWGQTDVDHRIYVTPIGGAGQRQTLDVVSGNSTVVVKGLEAGKKHRAIVIAMSGGRRSKPTYVYSTTKPNQPEDLQVTTLGSNSMVIRWTEPSSTLITGYRVIYFPTATNEMEVFEATTNRAEITELEPETEYEIQVQTEQGSELSAPTSITVTTKPETIEAPGNAEVSISGNDVIVRWSLVPGADSYEITFYPEDDEEAAVTRSADSPTSFYRITNVLPGHYAVQVAAVKDDQRSPTTDMTITMPVNPPTNLRISDVSRDELTATWDAPVNVIYTPTYDVIALPTSVHTPLELPSEKRTSEKTYTFERLAPNTEYRVEVIARYGALKSTPVTAVVSTNTLSPPDDVSSDITSGVITIRWSPVDDVDNYEVTYYPVGDDSNPVIVDVASGTTYYTFSSPGPGQYEITVTSVKDGERSEPITIRQQTGVEPPSSVSFTDVTENAMVVEWTPPRTRARYNYEITLTSADDVTKPAVVRTTPNNLQLFTDLEPATRYIVRVVTVFGERRSQPITGTITTGLPVIRRVEAPTILEGNMPIEVVWQEVPDADSYVVTYYPVGGSPQQVPVNGDRNSITLTDLEPETEYVVEVTAVINGIKGNPTSLTIETRPVGAPDRIETQPTEDVVKVVWTPVDNVDNYEVTYYPVGDRRNAVTKVVTSPYYNITGVEPGEYEITVTSIKTGHRSQPVRVVQRIGVKPPTNIDFTDATEDEFVVVWTPSRTRDVTKYVVRASVPDDLTQAPIIKETTDTFATFEDLSPGTTYVIEITAETPKERSKPLVGTVTTEIPSPEHVLERIPEEERSIELTWNPVPGADSYEVTYHTVGGTPQLILVDGEESGTILHDLEPGTEYIVQVTAIMNEGASNPVEVRVTTPLDKPKEPLAEPLSENRKPSPTSVRITWEPDDAAPVYEVKYYTVDRVGDQEYYGQPQIVRVRGNSGGTVLNDLLPATEYIVEIRALDGPKSSRPGIVRVTTPLDEPERVEVREPGEEEVTITWQRPVGEVTEYVIELVPTDGSKTIRIPVSPGRSSVRATGLQPGTEYEVRIVALNTDKRVQSQPGVGTVRTRPADVRPLNVQLRPESNGTYTIIWETPDRPVQKYIVNWTSSGDTPTLHSFEIPGTQNQFNIPELLPNTEYEIVIQSVTRPTDRVTNFNSITRRITTNVPGLPDSVVARDVSDQTIVVQWESPEQDEYLTGYRVEVFPEGSGRPIKSVDVDSTTNRVTVTGLKPSTTYVVKVTPHIDFTPGESATQTVITDEIRTIPVPDYLTVPEATSRDIVIQWEAPQNSEYITKYNIVVEDESGSVVLDRDVPGDTYTYTLTGLRPGTHYNVYVRSYVDDRPSEPAEELATTLPAKPEGVTPSNVRPNDFELSWTPPDGEVLSYLVNVEPEGSVSAQDLFFETERPSILIPNVEPDTTYVVQVITLGADNRESTPVTLRITTPSAPGTTTPGPEISPEESVNILPGQPEIVVQWESLPEDQPVNSYQVLYKMVGSDDTKIITVPSGVGEIILSELEPREQYEVWVRAILDTGENVPVQVTDRHTVTIVPPENYNPLTAEPIVAPEDGKISVIWESLGPSVTNYGVTYATPDSEEPMQVVVPGTYSGTLLTGLTPGEEYVINVIAVQDGLPSKVTNVNVGATGIVPDETSVTGESPAGVIKLIWVPDTEDEDYDKVIGYQITFDRKCCLGEPDVAWVPGKDSSEVTIELEPNTEYVFGVEARTDEGQNKPVQNVQVVVEEEEEPTPEEEEEESPPEGEDEVGGVTERVPDDKVLDLTIVRSTTTTRRPVVTRTRPATTTTKSPVVIVTRPRPRPETVSTTVIPEPLENAERTTRRTTTTTEPSPTEERTTRRTTTTTEPTPPETRRSTTRETVSRQFTRQTTTTRTEAEIIPEETGDTVTTDSRDITIYWKPFLQDREDGEYKVIISRPDRPDDFTETTVPGDVNTVTLTSLQPGTEYNIFVEAVTNDDFATFQIPINVNENKLPKGLHPYRYLYKPTITSIEPYGEDSTVVNWVNPAIQRREVTHYILQFTPKRPTDSSQTVRVEIPADRERTSHVITGLLPNQDYIVTLQVANAPTKTRSPTEKQDFVAGTVNIVTTTTRRTPRTRYTTPVPVTRATTRRTPWPRYTIPVPATRATTRRTPRPRYTTPVAATRATTRRTTRRPIVIPATRRPEPIRTTTPSAPQGGGIQENTTPRTVITEDTAGVDALPTFDGKVIINWTPSTTPVDNYILEYGPRDGPGQNISIPGDTSWTSIPEPINRPGYVITIYTVKDDSTRPLYNINLGKSPDTGGYHLTYGPAPDDNSRTTVTHTVRTQEVFIPGTRTEVTLPDTEYTFNPVEEDEYVHWLRPIVHPEQPAGGPSSVTLRWNPERTVSTTRLTRYRIELVPIDNPDAESIVTLASNNAPTNIRGLQPGVSYRLYAKYIRPEGNHRPGDIATSFVIPAFSRYGVPITERRFGINEVWMKEMRSGELFLQWDEFPEATEYTIEYVDSADGILHRSQHEPENRWIVLPRLAPGGTYTIHIYATVGGISTKIYTVTVRRKITAPLPPIKVEWYNMLGHSVDLSWLPPPSRITGYRITYYLGTSEDHDREFVIDLPANITKYTLRDLIPGETYTVIIQTLRGDEISRQLSFPLKMIVPTVRRLYFQQTEPEIVVIHWDSLPSYVTGYIVQVKQVSPPGPDLVPETELPSYQSDFTITGVKPNVRYEFTIRTQIGDKLSEPVTLHLWTLRAESRLSRVEQTGTWTVTWSGNAQDVDHWKIEVKRPGNPVPVLSEDNIDRFNTRYQIQDLTPGVEYIVYIYGVKGEVTSSPIQIRIPANPNRLLTSRRPSIYPTGPQLVSRFAVRAKPDQIQIVLYPVTFVDRYIIRYKKRDDVTYTTSGVSMSESDGTDIATITNLESGTGYSFSITAVRGEDRSEMNLNIRTPVRTVIKQPLYPVQNIRSEPDTRPGATGFYIKWSAPGVQVQHYTVVSTYTETGETETVTLDEPSIYVQSISEGYSATFTISYTALDGRESPKSRVRVGIERSTYERPKYVGRGGLDYPEEEDEDFEQP